MSQKKEKSIWEAITQTLIGTAIGFVLTYMIFPIFGIYTTVQVIGGITFVFMFISTLKNFLIRRLFNWIHHTEKLVKFLNSDQKKYQSFFESTIQMLIGTFVSFWSSVLIYPLFGLNVSKLTIGYITIVFMFVSLTKHYFIRRFYEKNKK